MIKRSLLSIILPSSIFFFFFLNNPPPPEFPPLPPPAPLPICSPGVPPLAPPPEKIETWEPFKTAPKGEPHNIYDVIPDSKNNVFFTDFRRKHIGRIDAATGELKLFEMPSSAEVTAPRRGFMDAQDRLWFGQYRGDRIGMFDTRTGQFKDWQVR